MMAVPGRNAPAGSRIAASIGPVRKLLVAKWEWSVRLSRDCMSFSRAAVVYDVIQVGQRQ
jgi:hypothetical protein